MITRDDYNKALDIVEAYQKQIFMKDIKKDKTLIYKWDKLDLLPTRVQNILLSMRFRNGEKLEHLEDITKKIFLIQRFAGVKAWVLFNEVYSETKIEP